MDFGACSTSHAQLHLSCWELTMLTRQLTAIQGLQVTLFEYQYQTHQGPTTILFAFAWHAMHAHTTECMHICSCLGLNGEKNLKEEKMGKKCQDVEQPDESE
jgi:hypothetical protein